jgi:hypothetical protein
MGAGRCVDDARPSQPLCSIVLYSCAGPESRSVAGHNHHRRPACPAPTHRRGGRWTNVAGYTRKWIRPSKLYDYYVRPFADNSQAAQYELYWAVVEGKVRARCRGLILTPKDLYRLRQKRWSDTDPNALPPNIELSVEDAVQIWREGRSGENWQTATANPVQGSRVLHANRQPARERAKRAIKLLYPTTEVPDAATLPNKILFRRVGDWLKEQKLQPVSDATILRAAGRRN